MNVVILTPISVEFRAVKRHLSGCRPVMRESTLYETGEFKGRNHTYTVTLRETGPKNSVVALAAERAARLFEPALIFLTGIAAGVKDAKIGDVVVGTKAYGYESGKETADGSMGRPEVLPFNPLLIETARLVSRDDAWLERLPAKTAAVPVYFGPIASGDKVIATTASPLYQYLKLHFNDTVALEMESIGFAMAVANKPGLAALNIRGISDLMDHKGEDFQQTAAERAAAFLFELLYQLEYTESAEKENVQPTKEQTPVVITNSKNVIVGGNFTVQGDFHLGDNKNNTTSNRGGAERVERQQSDPHAAAFVKSLQALIAKGRAQEAIEQFVTYTGSHAPDLRQEIIQLSDRWNQLAKKIRIGVISNSEATIERNQIISGVLDLAGSL